MLRCKISSANERAPGGPVSRDHDACTLGKSATSVTSSTQRSTSNDLASSRAQLFVWAKTTARRILQHCNCEGSCFCFAGLEWNGHSVCTESVFVATAANAQWFEIANQEQIAIATTAQRMLVFTAALVSRTTIKNSNIFFG